MREEAPRRIRLDRLLANLGYGSRREVQTIVNTDQVQLDGVTLKESEKHILLTADLPQRLTVDGEPLDPLPGMILMLHKPLGYTCSHREEGDLVYELFPPRWQERDPPLSTVGRLDKDTTGLLLLTDDGVLLHKIISPKSRVAKRYRVTLDRALQGNETQLLASGTLMLESESKPLLPVEMLVHSPTSATVILHEGRYHQVRRMFAALENHVVALHREAVGGLELPGDLEPGQYRSLSASELEKVFSGR